MKAKQEAAQDIAAELEEVIRRYKEAQGEKGELERQIAQIKSDNEGLMKREGREGRFVKRAEVKLKKIKGKAEEAKKRLTEALAEAGQLLTKEASAPEGNEGEDADAGDDGDGGATTEDETPLPKALDLPAADDKRDEGIEGKDGQEDAGGAVPAPELTPQWSEEKGAYELPPGALKGRQVTRETELMREKLVRWTLDAYHFY